VVFVGVDLAWGTRATTGLATVDSDGSLVEASALSAGSLAEPRRAIEVDPHPATIVLFGLTRLLRYKAKPGRTFADLREEMTRLLDHVEGLDGAEVPLRVAGQADWRAIREAVERADRKADLHRIEDRVDEVICAYIAFLTVTRPHAVRTLVGADGGYIVIPVTPDIGE
jgi:predicted RNase H-like nuclease